MGNSPKNVVRDKDNLKWSKSNAETTKIHNHNGKVYGVSCRKMDNDPYSILIGSCSQDGKLIISKLSLKINNKKGIMSIKKFSTKYIAAIPLRSAWVMTCHISPSLNYIASGGLDNICSIFNFDPNLSAKSQNIISNPFCELMHHTGYVASTKFINDKYILTASGDSSVILWDIQTRTVLTSLTQATGDVESVDYIFLNDRHIVAYCSIDKYMHIKDITEFIQQNDNAVANNDDDFKKKDNDFLTTVTQNDDDISYFAPDQVFNDGFRTDLNSCGFSPDGNYLAATSDDGSYNIYYRWDSYDHLFNVKKIEWKFLCKRKFKELLNKPLIMPVDYNGTAVTWADNKTVMVSADETQYIFCTQLTPERSEPKFVEAVNYGVRKLIESLPSMKWIGLTKEISNVILLYFSDVAIVDYVINPNNRNSFKWRTSSLAACKFGANNEHNIVVMGSWDKNVYSIISLNKTPPNN